MKSAVAVLALLCLAAGAFGIDISAGIGANGAYSMTVGKYEGFGSSSDTLTSRIPFTFMAFVDLTYLQVTAGYRMFNGAYQKTTVTGVGASTTESDRKLSGGHLAFAGYGKFPFKIGRITLFPMLGVEYDLTIAGTDMIGNDLSGRQKADSNEFWIKGGVGADISITPKIYVRPELIAGYKLLSQPEKDGIALLRDSGYSGVSILNLDFELAVLFGYRL